MRIVGCLYLFLFTAAAILKMPIRMLGPTGTLARAADGDAMAMFLEDTWVILGLAILSIGISLLAASRRPEKAIALAWTVICFELIWGLGSDGYQLSRGHAIENIMPWIIIHVVIITTGFWCLRRDRDELV